MHNVCYRLLRLVYGRKGVKVCHQLAMEYDRGLINIDMASGLERSILFQGYHEQGVVKIIKKVGKEGGVYLDVGANIGMHTLIMAFVAGINGRVIAIEPDPEAAARLRANIEMNGLSNVSVVEAALTASDGMSNLYTYEQTASNRGVSSLMPSDVARNAIRVRCVSGRTLQGQFDITACHLIKIDVEGCEMVVLTEFSDLIVRFRPFVIFEYNEPLWQNFGRSVEEAIDLFEAWNYAIYIEDGDTVRPLGSRCPSVCNCFCVPRMNENVLRRNTD